MSYPMVEFDSDGHTVRVLVTLESESQELLSMTFEYQAGCGNFARALQSHLCNSFKDAMREVKRAAYNKGWDDKERGLKRRKNDFYGDLDPDRL